jgi:hypothetical protein
MRRCNYLNETRFRWMVPRDKGMDEADAVLRKAVAYSIANVMRQQFSRGYVSDAGCGGGERMESFGNRYLI